MQRHARIGHIKLKPGFISLQSDEGRPFIYSPKNGKLYGVPKDFRVITFTPQDVLPVHGDGW